MFSDVAVLIDSKDNASKSLIVDRTHPVLVRVVLQKKVLVNCYLNEIQALE
jgi:hypothetical protein